MSKITLVAISNATSGHNLGIVTNCQVFADATCGLPNKLNYKKVVIQSQILWKRHSTFHVHYNNVLFL